MGVQRDVGAGAAICRLLCGGRGGPAGQPVRRTGLGAAGGRPLRPPQAAGPAGRIACTGLRKAPRPGSKNPAPVLLPRRG